jgi:hypothetical protein
MIANISPRFATRFGMTFVVSFQKIDVIVSFLAFPRYRFDFSLL